MRIWGIIIIVTFMVILFLSFLSEVVEIFEFGDKTTMTATVTTPIISNVPTIVSTLGPIETPARTVSPIGTTATITDTPTAIATGTITPTPTIILGYGKLKTNFFPLDEPNGKRVQYLIDGKLSDLMLSQKHLVIVVDSRLEEGGIWYRCLWEYNGSEGEGWILEGYIEFVPRPTSIP